MGLKNWTVTAESTKSAASREIYLHDTNHKNHKNTTAYIDVYGSPDTTINIIRNCEAYKLETAKRRKGGRPPTEAMEYVMTLPKGENFQPDATQWREMVGMVLNDVASTLGVERSQLDNIARCVVHEQDQNPNKKGAGNHAHLVLGKFTDSGEYLRDLQKKGVIHTIKQSFNHAVLTVMGLDHTQYTPDRPYNAPAKKRAPQWAVKAGRTKELLQEHHQKLKEKEKALEDRLQSLQQRSKELTSRDLLMDIEFDEKEKELEVERASLDEKSNQLKNLEKALGRFEGYATKWLEAFASEDLKQQNRQYNRMNKAIDTINAFEMNEGSTRWIESIKAVAEQVNSKSNKPLNPIKPSSTKPEGIKC